MNRAEFIRQLTILLSDVPPAEREEAIQYYNDYFEDAGAENEAGVIASLGTPEELARTIRAGLNDGGSTGEFTESGFKGYGEAHRDEVMDMGKRAGTNEQGAAGTDPHRRNPYGQGEPYGQKNPYEQNPYGQNPYGHNPYAQASGNQNPYGQADGGTAGNNGKKKSMSGGMIALIVIAVILTFPIWIGLAGALFGIAVGLLSVLIVCFVAFLAVGLVLAVVGVVLFAGGIAAMFSAPLGGLCMMGGGMICFAVGLVFIWLMVVVVVTVMPAFVRGTVNLCGRLFHRGGVKA